MGGVKLEILTFVFWPNYRYPLHLPTDVHVRIFWRSYSHTSWDFALERDWNFKTPFTHGLRHLWAKTPKSKLKFINNGLNIMLSDGWKSAFEMASEDPKKILLKSRKTRNCLTFLAISKALTIHPTNFLRQIFNTSFQTVRAKKLKLCKNFTLFITRAFPEFVWHGRKGPTLKGKRLRSVKSVKQFLGKKKKLFTIYRT